MLLSVQGEGAARNALRLAILIISATLFQGCKKPEIDSTNHYSVRVDTLLMVHPAWNQVVTLDRTINQFANRVPLREVIATPLPPMPPNLSAPPLLPPTVAQERQQRTRDYEAQYLQQLAETLRLQDKIYLTRMARRLEKEAESQYQKELAERNASIRAERLREAKDLDRQITILQFKDVAFQSQMNVYTSKDQAYSDAKLQHDRINALLAELSSKADSLVSREIIADLAKTALATRRQELQLQSEKQMEQEREALAAKRAEHIKLEQGKLTSEPDSLPSIETTPTPAPEEKETPLTLLPDLTSGVATQEAERVVKSALSAQQKSWQRQRERLIAVIRADTQQAVNQIAHERKWKLVPFGTSPSQDVTGIVKSLLQIQWNQSGQE